VSNFNTLTSEDDDMRNNVTPLNIGEMGQRTGVIASTDDRPWEFPVEMLPLAAVKSEKTPSPIFDFDKPEDRFIDIPPGFARAVIRTDTETCLGIHGNRYEIRPYADTVKFFEKVIEDSPLDLADAKLKFNMVGNGERMRISVDLPKHELDVNPKVGDIVRLRLNFMDSYDGAWSTQFGFGAMRLICTNGMVRHGFSIGVKSKHTRSDIPLIEDGHQRIAAAIQAFGEDKYRFVRWLNTPVTDKQADEFFTETMCKRWDAKATCWRINEHQLNQMMKNWYEEEASCGANMWGLYNALTRWATHGQIRKGSDPLNTIINREAKVEQIVQRDEWLKLAA
jgi:hypothetical protein